MPLYLAIAIAAGLILLELIGGDSLRGNTRGLNIGVLLFGRATRFLLPFVAVAVPISMRLLNGAALPFWLGALIFILAGDFFAYLFHRAQHAIPFMWAMHSLHHSDEHLNVLTTERHFWGDAFLKSVTSYPMAALVIHPTPPMMLANSVLLTWNYVTHANIRMNFGWWSWLLTCPAYHRRHHSILPEHFNSNYAAIFPIWDVLLGSYFVADSYPPTGLDEKPRNFLETVIWPFRRYRRPAPEPR